MERKDSSKKLAPLDRKKSDQTPSAPNNSNNSVPAISKPSEKDNTSVPKPQLKQTASSANLAVPPSTSSASSSSSSAAISISEKKNWLIHLLYIRQNYQQCLKMIDETLKECRGMVEYPLYIKGMFSITIPY